MRVFAGIIRAGSPTLRGQSPCGTIEQLIAENERLQLLIAELLMKNQHLRSRLQDRKSISLVSALLKWSFE
jgi:hypothetical protein